MVQERQLVEKITRALLPQRAASSRLKLGIGDDAAVISLASRTEWVLSCDTFLENVHFRLSTHPPDSVGYKALARATSDLAAMGATPRFFLLTLALPTARTGSWLDAFLRGMANASRELGLELVLRGHARNRQLRALVQPHLYPKIRIALGTWLAQHRVATSAMDLSD